MSKTIKDLEFEKNRMEILKRSGKSVKVSLGKNGKKAWEYEIEEYKKKKKLEKLYLFGAICGITSLVLNIILNFDRLLTLF